MNETATWSWQARDATGRLLRGTQAAADAAEVASRLRSEGRIVLSIDRAMRDGIHSAVKRRPFARRVSSAAVSSFIRQLSVMLDAGVPVVEAIEVVRLQTTDQRLSDELAVVRDEVENGGSLSDAFAKFPSTFPPVAVGLVRAAEAVGDLSGMFEQLADWLQREQRIRRQVRSALAYPVLLAIVGSLITILLVTFVMPRFEAIYAQRSADLPPLTEAVLGVGRFITSGWKIWVPSLFVAVTFGAFARRTRFVNRMLEYVRFDAPLLRSVIRPADLARATRTLGVLLTAGVPLLDAITICRGLSPWNRWSRFWNRIEEGARNGDGIADRFEVGDLVPGSARAMIAAGERSGRLPAVLNRVADAADEDLEVAVKRVSVMLEPLAIVVLGSVIGVVAIALLLPVFKMSTIAGG
ncbi:MAG: type II secretion system F family protein [Phycisphaerales bacterium]|nr:type II secretion system F family protein [Phycisphaerales bacterium]